MALTKVVNGVRIDLTPAEEAEVRAKWASEDKKRADDLAQNGYKYARADAYPKVVDQLDTLFHQGLDGWKASIQAIKDKYPKP